jgi:hypothetical protein
MKCLYLSTFKGTLNVDEIISLSDGYSLHRLNQFAYTYFFLKDKVSSFVIPGFKNYPLVRYE